jgi:exonuclease III
MSRGFWAFLALLATSSPSPIISDGAFNDWAAVPVTLRDPADAPQAALDFGEIRVTHDPRFIHLLIDFGRVVNPRSLDGAFSILFDADGNPATGWTEHGLSGVDLRVEFSPPQNAGVQLESASGRFSSYEAGLQLAPTYAARQAEIRLDRGARLGSGGPLFLGVRFAVKLVFTDPQGRVIDETEPIVYPLTSARGARDAPGPDPLKHAPDTAFRVLSWNVGGKAMLTRPDPFRRILTAVDPDLLLLDEVSGEASALWVQRLVGTQWQVVFSANGGHQRSVVAARRLVTPVSSLLRIDYPPQESRAILSLFPDPERRATLARDHTEGISTLGATVQFHDRRLLAVALDMQCCGDRPGCPEDRIRLMEVSAIHAGVRQALAAGSFDGVIVAGDFNLVASRDPLDRLADSLDLDGSPLSVAEPLQLNGLSNATWLRRGSPFPPGRLDYVLYSDSSLRLLHSFVFRSTDLSTRWLRRHHLQPDDSDVASDHLPLVSDFNWKRSY